MKAAIILLCALFAGCSSMPGMPGHISKTTSSYDGAVQYDMEPAFVYRSSGSFSGADIKMALSWNSATKDDSVVLFVEMSKLISIDSGPSLVFKVDGKERSFSSSSKYTSYDYKPGVYGAASVAGHHTSSKSFVVPIEFIRQIVAAKDVVVKIDTDAGYYSGVFSNNAQSSAVNAFADFLEKIDGRS